MKHRNGMWLDLKLKEVRTLAGWRKMWKKECEAAPKDEPIPTWDFFTSRLRAVVVYREDNE